MLMSEVLETQEELVVASMVEEKEITIMEAVEAPTLELEQIHYMLE